MTKTGYILATNPADDLVAVQAMAQELERYLLKDDVYRTVIVTTPEGDERIQMSGGDLLSRLQRLQAEREALSSGQQSALQEVQKQVDAVARSLRSRFHHLLGREMKARLDGLRWFLDDCREDRRRCRNEYPFEIRNRQRIAEIVKALGEELAPDLRSQLATVDRRLQEVTGPAEFVWDGRWQAIYPQREYWYLYVLP